MFSTIGIELNIIKNIFNFELMTYEQIMLTF